MNKALLSDMRLTVKKEFKKDSLLRITILFLSILSLADYAISREERLKISNIRTPEVIVLNETFDVNVSASDSVGIRHIEISLADRSVIVPAENKRVAVVSTELVSERAGYFELTALAVGADGNRGEPVSVTVGIADHSSNIPADEDSYEEMLQTENPFELYEPGEFHEPGWSTETKINRAEIQREMDAFYDGQGQDFGLNRIRTS